MSEAYGGRPDTKTQMREHIDVGGTAAKRILLSGFDGTNINDANVDSNGALYTSQYTSSGDEGIIQAVKEDANNSSTTNLTSANSYTFTGTGSSTLGVVGLQWNLRIDQNATVYIEQSDDNTNWDISDSFDYYYSKGGFGNTVQAITSYWRIRVVLTGTTDTTYFRLKAILCPIAEPLPRTLDKYDRLKVTSCFQDCETNTRGQIEPLGALKVIEPVRLVGTVFDGTTKDPNFWTETVTGTGAAVQAGKITLSTGTTADSTAKYCSVRKARNITGALNQFRTVSALTTDAQANNIRRIGAYDDNEGFFFQANGTTMQVVSRKAGSDTAISTGSFNGNLGATWVPSTNTLYRLIIEYSSTNAKFFVNGIILHTISNTVAGTTNTLTLPVCMENINSGGNTTNNSFIVFFATILRLGKLKTDTTSKYISTNTTTICKYGAGELTRILNVDNAGSVTIYDNTEATGTIIAVIDTAKVLGNLDFDTPFSIGLTVVTANGTKVVVIYE